MSESSTRAKMVALAREMLAGAVGLLKGTRQLADLSRSLSATEASDPEVLVFVGVDSEVDDMPTGSARGRCGLDVLCEPALYRTAVIAA